MQVFLIPLLDFRVSTKEGMCTYVKVACTVPGRHSQPSSNVLLFRA